MKDKDFRSTIESLLLRVTESKYEEVLGDLKKMGSVLAKNDLSMYLAIKSLEEDVKNQKVDDLLRKSFEDLIERIEGNFVAKTDRVSNFLVAILSFTVLPLTPFLANWLNEEENTRKDVVLTLAMYSISIALSVKSTRLRMFGMISTVILFLMVNKEPPVRAVVASFAITVMNIIAHVWDRYERHLKGNEPYI